MITNIKYQNLLCIVFILCLFTVLDSSAANDEDKKEKEKIEVEPEKKKKCDKADSLNNLQERKLVKDSISNNSESSMSSMSYNILFQVIYRYSFKEIFDSPAASEIVTH